MVSSALFLSVFSWRNWFFMYSIFSTDCGSPSNSSRIFSWIMTQFSSWFPFDGLKFNSVMYYLDVLPSHCFMASPDIIYWNSLPYPVNMPLILWLIFENPLCSSSLLDLTSSFCYVSNGLLPYDDTYDNPLKAWKPELPSLISELLNFFLTSVNTYSDWFRCFLRVSLIVVFLWFF